MRSKSASAVVSIVPTWTMPAMLARMSMRPAAFSTAAMAARVSAALLTSHRWASAFPPAATIRSATRRAAASSTSRTVTRAPCFAKRSEIAAPIPEAPPVTTATLWVSSNMSRDPENRLPDEIVPHDLFHLRVRGQRLPQRDVIGLAEGEAAEEEAGLAHRPLRVVHDVRGLRPRLLVADVRDHVGQGAAQPASVRKRERPEIVVFRPQRLGDTGHGLEVEERVAVRFRAPQLLREASVRRDLAGHDDGLEPLARPRHPLLVAHEAGEGGHLEKPAGGVVVPGVAFLERVLVRGEPGQVIAEPAAHPLALRRRHA